EYGGYCSGGNWGDASAWDMVAGGGGPQQYVQLGYDKNYSNGHTYYFYEANDGVGADFAQRYFPGWVAYSAHTYLVEDHVSMHHIAAYLDGTFEGASAFDPATKWNSGWNAQWFGEAHDKGDDIPGLTYANQTSFGPLGIQFCSSCTYYDPGSGKFDVPNGVNDNPARWGYNDFNVCFGA